MVGAGPISEDLEKAVKKRTGIKQVGQSYGLTESTVALTFTPFDTEKHGSCGKLLPHLSAVVKDLETGRNLGPNQTGELCFKEKTFTKDGYMRTGDVGYYDEEGFFYIVDRLKELIKYKGYQVPPAELEAVLLTNSKIKEVAVVGVPDADAGELPLAFVVKQSGVDLTQKEVVEFVNEKTSESITYRELYETGQRLAISLRNCGLTQKSIIAICSSNSTYYLLPIFAAIFEGIPVVPINPTYTECKYHL
ncbi:long-chain-fatty-acid--coa ligase [Holotrichia oblita]|uniref:Long-chain-fatty-acid--coa ligase n=1 Tax=Holotrichia oblita TaxID=644536 RepID=A0ACB9TT93_HOLOL|nr:long-chain-fatty-acid--coa ligase [Holotrichia oblita]